jgi:Ca2+-binding EF-hand superfamily protein
MEIFEACDHNGDGKISLEEFVTEAVDYMCQ